MPLRRSGIGWPEEERLRSEQLQAAARVGLGADAYAAAFAEGQAMTLEAAVTYAESVVQIVMAETRPAGSAARPLRRGRRAANVTAG